MPIIANQNAPAIEALDMHSCLAQGNFHGDRWSLLTVTISDKLLSFFKAGITAKDVAHSSSSDQGRGVLESLYGSKEAVTWAPSKSWDDSEMC
jgi:hypothetical protein